MYESIIRAIDAQQAKLEDLAQKMWDTPEVGYDEVHAAKWTVELMKEYGFEVEFPYVGMPTAVKASWGKGHPVIGILGELDALPGLSQKQQTTKAAAVEGAPGQGCGHNLLNVSSIGAAVGIKAYLEETGKSGTVVFYGCPAEELLTGKVFMARGGAFRDLDFAFAWHGGNMNGTTEGTMNGLNSAIFHFSGRTAHAAGDPYNGRSALDAAEIMNVGANYLREHVTSDVRIHYSYKEAGTAPNIVPDKASVWYYVRALSRQAIEDAYARIVKCAEGAAHMTETDLSIEFLGGCYPSLNNHTGVEVVLDTMKEIPSPVYTEEELAFAKALNEASPMYEQAVKSGSLDGGPIATEVGTVRYAMGGGSSDVGDVAHIVPCTSLTTATCNAAAPGHSWQICACAGNSIGYKGMLYGAKVMAVAAAKMYDNPSIIEKAAAEFKEAMKGDVYHCPIPEDVPIPQPVHSL